MSWLPAPPPSRGSPSRFPLRLRFFYSLLDSRSGCQHPLDPAPKTPPASLFGPLLSQFFLSPVPSSKTPASPSFSLCAHADTFSHRPQETQHAPPATCPNSASCPAALLPRPHTSLSGTKGTLVTPSPFFPVGFLWERSGEQASSLSNTLPPSSSSRQCPDPTAQKVSLRASRPDFAFP